MGWNRSPWVVASLVSLTLAVRPAGAWVTLVDNDKAKAELETRLMFWGVSAGSGDVPSGPAQTEDIEDFFKTYYGPNNCTLVLAGDIKVAEAKNLVQKYFGSIPPGPPVNRAQEWVPELTQEVDDLQHQLSHRR